MFYLFNGIIVLVLVLTLGRIVMELREQPRRAGRISVECVWTGVLVLLLLYNFNLLRF